MGCDGNTSGSRLVGRGRMLAAMFLLGAFSTLAQVTFLREMLVVFFGNELVIGTIMASWLVGISLGAFLARILSRYITGDIRITSLISASLLSMAVLLPFQVYAVKVARLIFYVPAGEYASFASILAGSFLIFLPTCAGIGLIFPFACELESRSGRDGEQHAAGAVSLIYKWESLGSMIGGVVLTYVLLPLISPLRIVLAAVSICSVSAAMFAAGKSLRWASALLALGAALVMPLGVIDRVEHRAVEDQWRTFGVFGEGGDQAGATVTRLVASENSVYQNLAVTESAGQFAFYANGRVMFIFPDPIGYEHSVHFVMAQNPGAKRVLLIGGNPVGDIPELLKYPLERLVYVELDPTVGRLVERIKPEEYRMIRSDKRVTFISRDAPRYVQGCREQFDAILVNAPEPATAAANRFYTLEFYRNVRRILAADGFMYTSLSSSERLQSETADMGASVYRTIREVFPVVLVTAEMQNRYFAGRPESGLTFNRDILCERSTKAAVKTQYFQPKYFLGLDEIAPDKTQFVKDRFSSVRFSLNTNLKPVTYFYNLMLWSRFSGSGLESVLGKLKSVDFRKLTGCIFGCGLFLLVAGIAVRMTGRTGGADAGAGKTWMRLMAVVLIATTGFCGMALEVLLIFIFQGLYGYVYSMMGLIVAVFMLGLVLGAPSGRMMAGKGAFVLWFSIALIEALLLVIALAVPGLFDLVSTVSGSGRLMKLFEILIYVSVGVIGWAVGAEFPLVNRLYSESGVSVGRSAAVTDVADHLGAAVGAVVVGVVLVPVMGIEISCVVIAAVKCLGLLGLAAAFVSKTSNTER